MVIADNLYCTAALGWPGWPLYGNHFPGWEWIVCRTGTKLASCMSPSLYSFPPPPPPNRLLITSLFERQGFHKVKSSVIKATKSQELRVNLESRAAPPPNPRFVPEPIALTSADAQLMREAS